MQPVQLEKTFPCPFCQTQIVLSAAQASFFLPCGCSLKAKVLPESVGTVKTRTNEMIWRAQGFKLNVDHPLKDGAINLWQQQAIARRLYLPQDIRKDVPKAEIFVENKPAWAAADWSLDSENFWVINPSVFGTVPVVTSFMWPLVYKLDPEVLAFIHSPNGSWHACHIKHTRIHTHGASNNNKYASGPTPISAVRAFIRCGKPV